MEQDQVTEGTTEEAPEYTPEQQEMIAKAAELGIGPNGEEIPVEDKAEATDGEEAPLADDTEEVAEEVTPEPVKEPSEAEQLKKEIEYLKRQFGDVQSRLSKAKTEDNTTAAPSMLDQLPEDQREATRQLVSEIVRAEMGEDIQAAKDASAQLKQDAQMRKSMASMESHLGQDYGKIEPVLAEMMGEIEQKLQSAPDQESFELASREMALATFFPEAFADRAKLRHAMQVQSKSKQAVSEQVNKNFKKTTATTGQAQNTGRKSTLDRVNAGEDVPLEDLEKAYKAHLQ